MNRGYVGRAIDRLVTVVNQFVNYTPLSIVDFKDHFSARGLIKGVRQRNINCSGSRDHYDVGASMPGAP
jgi:hypothetical protein